MMSQPTRSLESSSDDNKFERILQSLNEMNSRILHVEEAFLLSSTTSSARSNAVPAQSKDGLYKLFDTTFRQSMISEINRVGILKKIR